MTEEIGGRYGKLSDFNLEADIRNSSRCFRIFDKAEDKERAIEVYSELIRERRIRTELRQIR